MNIGAIGWWHYDNQGDLAMLNALRQSFAPHRIIALDTDLEYNEDTLLRLNCLDFLLLGGGTLIHGRPLPLFREFRHWGSQLHIPLGVLGLGVSHIESDSAADIQALIEQSRFFYTRDETSRHLLGHPAVGLAPDLTFACPLPFTAHPLSNRTSPLGGANLRETNNTKLAAWVAALQQLPCQWRGLPLSSFSSWQEQQGLRALDSGCAPGFSTALYDGLDLVVGTALHAVIFAVQAGVPVIAIDYASKVRRFMSEIGLGDYVLAADEMAELPAMYGRLLENHEEIRQLIGRQRSRLMQESQIMFDRVRALIETADETKSQRGKKVTVIVLANDSPDKLNQTLTSCQEQTYANVETIVVGVGNAGSTGRVLEDKVTYLMNSSPAAGLAGQLNGALAEASGEYVSWLAAGDCFAADAIGLLVERLEEAQADLVYANYYILENGKIESQLPAHPPYKLKRHNVVTPCFLYRRRLHEAAGSYDSRSPLPAYDFWLRVAAEHRLCPVRTPLLLAQKRQSDRQVRLERTVRRCHFDTLPFLQRLAWKCMDNALADQLLLWVRGIGRQVGVAAEPLSDSSVIG